MKSLSEYIFEYVVPNAVLYLKSETQRFLWFVELVGQISDGMWENSKPGDHWEFWANINVEIGNKLGVKHKPFNQKAGYSFVRLIPIIGNRMLIYGKLSKLKPKKSTISISDISYLCYGAESIYYKLEKGMPLSEIYDNAASYEKKYINMLMDYYSDDELVKLPDVNYTEKDLRKDLQEISSATKTVIY